MTTALKIIERGAAKAKVKSSAAPLTDGEIEDGLDILNDVIKEWTAIGILTGVSPTYDPDVDLMEPDYATPALKSQVGMRMIVEYGYDGDLSVAAADANQSYHNMLVAKPKRQIVYPDTLPKGSGNHSEVETISNDFFPTNQTDNF